MGNEEVTSWLQDLQDTTFVIQLTANKLYGFRSDRTGVSHQIDNVLLENEAKLIRQFSRILYLKLQNENETSAYKIDNFGGIDLWLNIVNVGENTAKALKTEIKVVEELLHYHDVDLEELCDRCGITGDDRRRFVTATRKLKIYTKRWIEERREPKDEFADSDLFWFSYERSSNLLKSPHFSRENPNRRSISESGVDSGASDSGLGSHLSQASLPTASPPASPASTTSGGVNAVHGVSAVQPPTTATHLPPKSPSSLFSWSFGGGGATAGSSPSAIIRSGLTPPSTPSYLVNQQHKQSKKMAAGSGGSSVGAKAPTTPPPSMKWGTASFGFNPTTCSSSTTNQQISPGGGGGSPANCSMTRSRSHDSNLPNRIVRTPAAAAAAAAEPARLISGSTAPSTSSLGPNFVLPLASVNSAGSLMSPDRPGSSSADAPLLSPTPSLGGGYTSPTSGDTSLSLQVPKSPRAAVRMVHNINHRFNRMWKPSMRLCFYCNKAIGLSGERCVDCRIKVHTLCKPLVGPTCGLTAQRLRQIYDYILAQPSTTFPISPFQGIGGGIEEQSAGVGKRSDRITNSVSFIDIPQSSSSSCTSSAPSTPAAVSAGQPQPSPGAIQLVRQPPKFAFPDIHDVPNITVDEASEFRGSQGSDHTIHTSNEGSFGEGGSEQTLSPDDIGGSTGSNDSNFSNNHEWRRDTWSKSTMRRNAWGEWTIPIEEIQFRPDSARRGRFGEVLRAYWHQDVAVKLLNMDHVDDEKQLETFKLEVSTFRSTRHENLVLFLGCCMNPPKLGIVMNWCRGPTLYTLLHGRGERLDMNRVINIAIHIAQGMSYLHGKKIVHKDLRTKNVFIEKNKAVITDFGLFSVGRLLRPEKGAEKLSLHVPEYWLCYLAPEIMRNIMKRGPDNDLDELPFSNATDVYAFGTVWYELITNEFPFKRLPPESIIWQVGRGVKPALSNITAVKEVKDMLMQCWASKAADRYDFNGILKTFEKMPRKRLARSPSHPVHVSRSAEAVF